MGEAEIKAVIAAALRSAAPEDAADMLDPGYATVGQHI